MFKHSSPLAALAVIIAILPCASHAQNATWTNGAGSGNVNWAKNTNWSGNTTPVNGNSLFFSGTKGLSNTDNISGLSVNGITFASGAGAFTLNGQPITVSGTIANNSANTQTLSFNSTGVTLGAGLMVQSNAGAIDFATGVNLNGFSMEVTGSNTVSFDQKITGTSGGLLPDLAVGDPISGQAGNVVLNANNNTLGGNPGGYSVGLYSGSLTVTNGGAFGNGTFLIQQSGSAAGVTFATSSTGSNGINVMANVDVLTSFNIAANISGTTAGMAMSGTVTLDTSINNTFTITAETSNTVRFANTIQQSGTTPASLTLNGNGGVGGSFLFGGTNANTYAGLTTVTGSASLVLKHSDDNIAIAGDLQIDAGSWVVAQGENQLATTSNVTADGTFDLNSNNEVIASLSGTGLVKLGSGTLTLGSGTYSGDIRDNGNGGVLVVNGTSTLELDSASHYSGGTVLNSGTLLADDPNALGSGTLTINGTSSTLGSLPGGLHLGNAVDALTSFNVAPSGTVGSGTLSINGLVTLDTSGGTTDFRLTATNGNVFRFFGGIAQSGTGTASLTYDGGGSGVNGIFRIGNSTAASTYGGLTTVTDFATLILNNSGASVAVPGNLQIDAGSTVSYVANSDQIADTATVTDDGTLNLNGRNETIASLLGSGTIQTTGTSGSSGTFTIGSGTFTGGIGGTDFTLTKTGTGTLQLTGPSFVTGTTNINGGTLILDGEIETLVNVNAGGTFSGTGFVADIVNNSSVVAPGHAGAPGTINMKTYVQSSAGTLLLRIGGTGPGQSDQVNLGAGNATLDGTLQLVRLNNFQGALGEKITLLSSNLLSGTFSDVINPFQTNTMVKADIVYQNNNVYLSFDQGSFLQFAQQHGLTPNETAVAGGLDSIAGNPQFAALLGFLDNQPLQNLAGDFNLISPDKLTAIFDISRAHADVQGANIENRLADDRSENAQDNVTIALMSKDSKDGKSTVDKDGGTSAEAYREKRWGFFMEGSGEFARASSDLNSAGYNFTTAGVTLGADYRFNDHFVAGIMGGYANTGATTVNNGSVAVNGGRLGVYGTLYGNGLYLDGMAAGGYNSYDTHRLGLGGIARGNTDGAEFDGLLSTGYDAHQGALTFGPVVSLQYTHVGINGFNEAGSLAPLNILSQSQDSLRSKAGFRISYGWKLGGVTVTPAMSAGWQHEYLNSAFALDSQFANGAGNVFTTRGPALGRDSVVVDGGVSVQWSPRVATYLYYYGELGRTNYQLNSVTGGVRLSF
ncbi:MAG TPA: autotransporter domain-containing protein [Chthoniobacteraceae bacterium]|nr:autotransporter domain-containing protein [Chthoniobacteraceae bacterium]